MWVVTTTYSLDIGLLCPEGQQKWLENTPHEGAEVNAVRIFFLNKNLESIGSCLLCWVWNFSRAFFCTSSLSDFLRFFCFCCWNDHEPSDISVTWPRPGCYSLKSGERGRERQGTLHHRFLPGSLLSMLSHMVYSVRIEVVIISVKGGKAHTDKRGRTHTRL